MSGNTGMYVLPRCHSLYAWWALYLAGRSALTASCLGARLSRRLRGRKLIKGGLGQWNSPVTPRVPIPALYVNVSMNIFSILHNTTIW